MQAGWRNLSASSETLPKNMYLCRNKAMGNSYPEHIYTVDREKSGMIGVFTEMTAGSDKFGKAGLGVE